MTTTPLTSRAATVAATFSLALALAPRLAAAQTDALPPTWHEHEELYAGGPVPAGAHRAHRPNGYLAAAGAVLFAAGYLPWAIQGLGDAGQSPQTNAERSSIFRVIPLAGPFIANLSYDQHQRDDCTAFMAMYPTGTTPPLTTTTTACVDRNGGMYTAAGVPYPTSYAPVLSTGGDWVWAFTQFGAQAVGIGLFIAGLIGQDVVVYDDPHAQAMARRDHRGALRWSLVPNAPGAQVGLTLAATQF